MLILLSVNDYGSEQANIEEAQMHELKRLLQNFRGGHTSEFIMTTFLPIRAFLSMIQFLHDKTLRQWNVHNTYAAKFIYKMQIYNNLILVFSPTPTGTFPSDSSDNLSASVW